MNKDHLNRLRYQTETWNVWRRQHPEICPDLSGAEINSLASRSTLERADSIFRQFQTRSFQGLDLHGANLRQARIWLCDFIGADFRAADLSGAELRRSQLQGADFRAADLRSTQFLYCRDLNGARFDGAIFGGTHFGFTALGGTQGLDQVRHQDRSMIDQFTLIHSLPMPFSFLHACGVPPHVLRMAELYATSRPYFTCFISYSRRDTQFVTQLREALTLADVPSWFAPEDMRDEALQSDNIELERDLYTYVDVAERLLLVVSPNILPSSWVGKEYQRARAIKPVIALLIAPMPLPRGRDWESLIAATVQLDSDGKPKYSQLNPEGYSQALAGVVNNRQYFDFQNWKDPFFFQQGMSFLISSLERRA